jgi:hypothetical protein
MAQFLTNITLTNGGTYTLLTATGLPNGITEVSLPHDSYQPERKTIGNTETIWFRPLNGAEEVGYIRYDDVVSPATGDIDELWEVLVGFFSLVGGGLARMTRAELLALISAQSLGQYVGTHILVTDLFDEGGIFLGTSATTISIDGQGLFLDCDFSNVGDYSDVEPLTGVAVTGTTQQWRPSFEAFTITYSNLVGGSFAVGETVDDGLLWQGVIISDNGTEMSVYSIDSNFPDDTGILDNGTGVTADIDTVGTRTVLGTVSIWYDTTSHTYQHWQCTDDTALDGTINPTAYTVLPRGGGNYGYIRNACMIEYDLMNDWLQRRHCETVTIFASFTLFGALGYNLVGAFPWGDPTHVSIRSIDGFWNTYNSLATSVSAITIDPQGLMEGIFRENCTVSGIVVGSYGQMIPDMGAGSTLSEVTVMQSVTWQHVIAPAAVINNMVVTVDSIDILNPISVANNDMQGFRVQETNITHTQLLNDIGAGIVIAPDTAQRFNRCSVFLWFECPFAAYLGPGLLVTVGGVTVGTPDAALMTTNPGNKIEVALDFNVLGVPENTSMILTTVGGVNLTDQPLADFNFLDVTVTWS